MQIFLSVSKRAISTVVLGCGLATTAAQPGVPLRLAASLKRGPDAEQSVGCGEALCRTESRTTGFWRIESADNALAWLAAGNLNKTRGTLALRFRPAWPAGDHAERLLFSDSRNFSIKDDNALRLWIVRWDRSYLRFDMRSRDDRYITVPLERLPAGRWHHLAATWDSTKGTRLFVDGQLAGERQFTYEPKPPGDILRLGGGEGRLDPGLGDYRDLVILDRPLTPDEVAALAAGDLALTPMARAGAVAPPAAPTAPTGPPRVVFRAAFDGSLAADGPGGKAAILPRRNANLRFVPSPFGQAVYCGAGAVLEYPGGDNVPHRRGSLAFWVRPDWSVQTAKSTHVFFREAPPDRPGDDCRWIWYQIGKSRLRFDLRDPRDSYVYADIGGWRAGTWHFVVQTWDAEAGRFAEYIDGRPITGGSDRGKAFLHPSWTPRPKTFFWIGSRGGRDPAMAAFDEVTTYDRMLTAAQVRRLYATHVPVAITVPRPYLPSQARVQIEFELRNLRDVPIPGPPAVRLFAGDAAQPCRRWTLKSAQFAPRQVRRLTVQADGLAPGDYRLEVVPRDENALPGPGAFLRICFPEPPRASTPAARLVQETDLTRELPDSVFCDDGTSKVARSAAGAFREAGKKRGARFAVRLRIEKPGQWHRLEWTWPDDRPRTMDIIVNGCRYDVATGILAGDEYPNSGRMQTRAIWFWPRRADDALVFMTAENGRPAAAARVRLYELSGPPAALDVPRARYRGAPDRQVGLYYEDPVLATNFGGTPEFPSFKAVADRLTAYMDACGLNVLYYPAVWYHGPLYPSPSQGEGQLGSRPHPPDFIRYLLMRFEKHGFRLVATFNVHDLPSLANCVTDAARVRAGASTPLTVQWDTSLKTSGWHGTPGDFNPLAPEVHTAVRTLVREIADRYGDSPAFGGICLHLPRHSLLWFGSTDTGYNDENLHGFENDTGLRLGIDYASPVRANRAYRTLRSKYWERWLDWRCTRLARQWAEYAGILRERRPDLTLAVNLYTVLDETNVNADKPADRTDFVRAARDFGADMRLLARIPNIQLMNTFSPGLYRWHRSRRGPFRPAMRVFRTANFVSNAYRPFAELGCPFGVNLHDKYWEDAIGRTSPLEGLKKWGQHELGWRVSTPVPAEPYALENYAEAMGEADVTVLTKGGFVVGTVGMELALGKWATAFRQLPAVPFTDVPGLDDPVRVRTCARADGDWCSVQNRLPYSLTVSLSVTGPGPAADLAGRRELRLKQGRIDLELAPYQLVALWGRPGTFRVSGGKVRGIEAVAAQLAQRLARLRRALAARPGAAPDRTRRRMTLVEQALAAGRLARATHLLEGPWAARLEHPAK